MSPRILPLSLFALFTLSVWLTAGVSLASDATYLDVELQDDSTFSGTLVDGHGAAKSLLIVEMIEQQTGNRLTADTDRSGNFAIRLPRGGLYQCLVDGEFVSLRVWKAGSAPPNAIPRVLLVLDDAVSGQSPIVDPEYDGAFPVSAEPANLGTCDACRNGGLGRKFHNKLCGRSRLRCFCGCGSHIGCGCNGGCGIGCGWHGWGSSGCAWRVGIGVAAGAIIYASIEEDDAS